MIDGYSWWQGGVIYQVYPRSFMDSNGDGVGDLRGITSRLDHLRELGVDAVWISPIFPSPMADFGYDVSDYTNVHPLFGTLSDFDAMVEKAHELGLKVILDYVPNHTSDEHEWFVESRSSRENPKRDWYVWRDAKPDGSPPNNWLSEFDGGSAWEWDEATGQYYYHAYDPRQPDLDWRNPEVRAAMNDALRFWLDRGVDGFRVDAVNHLMEDESFRDNPENPDWKEGDPPSWRVLGEHTVGHPDTLDAVAGMRRTVEEYDGERFLIGEVYLPTKKLMKLYGENGTGFHAPTNMDLVKRTKETWNAAGVAAFVEEYEEALPGDAWPNWVAGNHDNPRLASKFGAAQARVMAMLLLTLRGTPTIYYGEELGMTNGDIPPELQQDPAASAPGYGRDPERTPMHWDSSEKAGFTTGEPWLPVSEDRVGINVLSESEDPRSMLTLYRGLLALRRGEEAFSVGTYRTISSGNNVLVYEREHSGRKFVVALNFDSEEKKVALEGRITLSTHLDRDEDVIGDVTLRGDEGILLEA